VTRQSETTEQREYRRKKLVMPDIVETLLGRGVVIPCPAAVEIGADLDAERIASGVVVHAGCKILGAKTSIGPGCVLGAEAPTTVENCQLGAGVALKGGYHAGSVFLDEANMGSGAQVRPGTLLEEEANGAHTVGFKQTVFLSYVTAGSLINFCDALMAGGTSRKNHSEIGSSYIHFNYTPHGDKATASLIGDVPRGVMLDQSPIFLGGQGGLVGPVRIEYGCVIPAGVIRRKEGLEPAQLLSAAGERVGDRAYRMGVYHGIDRIVANNLIYIGNIRALRSWYAVARRATMDGDKFSLLPVTKVRSRSWTMCWANGSRGSDNSRGSYRIPWSVWKQESDRIAPRGRSRGRRRLSEPGPGSKLHSGRAPLKRSERWHGMRSSRNGRR
jgi:UDP-N-acetylglucosamine/UDP-N-acetylgalactosamine diphosphorylase